MVTANVSLLHTSACTTRSKPNTWNAQEKEKSRRRDMLSKIKTAYNDNSYKSHFPYLELAKFAMHQTLQQIEYTHWNREINTDQRRE